MPRTCFVISPIGEPGTDIRRLADDLLELIIAPALESLAFEVVRADRIIGSGVITSEIVNLVQNAELCIIDLTGHNANVFYECGRRHETARPFIQVIRKGEKPPFDVAGIRTIYYDLTDAREVRNTVLEVRKYAEAVVRDPSVVARTSMSATSIADALDRLERKVDQLSSAQASSTAPPQVSSADPLAGLKRIRSIPPSQMYLQAVAQGNWELAAKAVERLREKDGLEPHVIAAAITVASMGEAMGATIIYEVLDSLPPGVDPDDAGVGRVHALTGLGHYYVEREEEEIGLSKLREPMAELCNDPNLPPKDRALLANLLQQLAYGAADYALAAEWGEQACELAPEDSYWANLSMDYEGLGNMVKAKDAVDEALHDPLEDTGSFILGQAIDIYSQLGDEGMVERLYSALRVVDPEKANYKQFVAHIKRGVQEDKRK